MNRENNSRIVLVSGRTNELRYWIPVLEHCLSLGYRCHFETYLPEKTGAKSFLNYDAHVLEMLQIRFPEVSIVNRSDLKGKDTDFLYGSSNRVYVSLDPPQYFVNRFRPPTGPWVQLQHGADLFHSIARASIQADLYGLWGPAWLSSFHDSSLSKALLSALDLVGSKPHKIVGHLGLNAISCRQESKTGPGSKRVVFFEPKIRMRQKNPLVSSLNSALFTLNNWDQILELRRLVRGTLDEVKSLGYNVEVRRRRKAGFVPIGYHGETRALSPKFDTGDPSDDIRDSAAIITFSPSTSILEAMATERRVIAISRERIENNSENKNSNLLWPVYRRLSSSARTAIVEVSSRVPAARALDRFHEPVHAEDWRIANLWIARDFDQTRELDRLLWEAAKLR